MGSPVRNNQYPALAAGATAAAVVVVVVVATAAAAAAAAAAAGVAAVAMAWAAKSLTLGRLLLDILLLPLLTDQLCINTCLLLRPLRLLIVSPILFAGRTRGLAHSAICWLGRQPDFNRLQSSNITRN